MRAGARRVLTSARAGVDVIFHAFEMDEEGLDAVLENGSILSPALTFVANTVEFTRPSDPCFKWRPTQNRRVIDDACEMLIKARERGVPFMVGTDSGFAITPYGEWHAKELELMVDDLGFTPGEALKATTSGNSALLRASATVSAASPRAPMPTSRSSPAIRSTTSRSCRTATPSRRSIAAASRSISRPSRAPPATSGNTPTGSGTTSTRGSAWPSSTDSRA